MTKSTPQIALRYPLGLRVAAAALILAPIAAGWIVWAQNPQPPEEIMANLIPWAVLGIWMFATYQVFLVELYYDDRGITSISPITGEVRLNWSEVTALYYMRGFEAYVLEADDGRRIWFNEWRSGIPEFAAAIQNRLPRQAQGGR